MLKLIPVVLLFVAPVHLFSQDQPLIVKEAATGIVNGKEYYPYFLRSKRKPLLFMDRERTSTVNINKVLYDAVLHFDTYTGEVIYSVPPGTNLNTSMISLNRDVINSFTLNFNDDTLLFERFSGKGLDEGFYEIFWHGPTTFLIHHRSLVFERNGIDEYFYRPVSYVYRSGEYYRVKSVAKFAELFGDDSELIKELARKYRVNFKDPERNSISAMLKEYDKPEQETR